MQVMYNAIKILFILCIGKSLNAQKAHDLPSRHTMLQPSEQLLKFLANHSNCSRTEWECNKECRLQFVNRSTGLCRKPQIHDSCFGTRIRYNYTDENVYLRSLLPKYELLSRFPGCWSSLSPLICAVSFRPCANRSYFELTMTKPGKMEMWQVFRKEMCIRAREKCGFLVQIGLWPDFINCEDTSDQNRGRRLFSDGQCKMSYKSEPSSMNSNQCIWPLIRNHDEGGYDQSRPVIDECYLPCRSPLLNSDWVYDGFKSTIFIYSIIIAVILFVVFVYLMLFSQLWIDNLCVYIIGNSLISFFIYTLFWIASFSESFSKRTVCYKELRRNDFSDLNLFMDWCYMQALLMHTFILSGYSWIFLFIFLRLTRPRIRRDHCIRIDGKPTISYRCVSLLAYLISALIAVSSLWFNTIETDGITGICFIGLNNIYKALFFIYLPVSIGFFLSLVMSILLSLRRKKGADSNNVDNINDESLNLSAFPKVVNIELQPFVLPSGMIQSNDDSDCGNIGNGCGDSSISSTWIGIICGTILCIILLCILLHFTLRIDDGNELRLIMESINCSLTKTLLENEIDWLSASKENLESFTADPLQRKLQIGNRWLSAPGCALSYDVNDRLLLIFLVFLVVPSIPFLVLIVFILTGFCGYGLKDVNRIRKNLNPFLLDTSTKSNMDRDLDRNIDNESKLPCKPSASNTSTSTIQPSIESDMNIDAKKRSLSADHFAPNFCNNSLQSYTLSDSAAKPPRKSRIRRQNLLKRCAQQKKCFDYSSEYSNSSIQNRNVPWIGSLPPNNESFNALKSNASSFNMTSVSNQGNNGYMFTDSSAYRPPSAEYFWQERCSAYLNQIIKLTESLRMADEELRRVTRLLLSQNEVINFSNSSTVQVPFINNRCRASDMLIKKDSSGEIKICESTAENPLRKIPNEETEIPVLKRSFEGNTSQRNSSGNEQQELRNIAEDGQEKFSHADSASSNTFFSDEEDSEEERLLMKLKGHQDNSVENESYFPGVSRSSSVHRGTSPIASASTLDREPFFRDFRLTEEQKVYLKRLRNQITQNDILTWSDDFIRIAREMKNQRFEPKKD